MLCECIPIGSSYFGIPHAIGDTGLTFKHSNSIQTVVEFIVGNKEKDLSFRARQRIVNYFNFDSRKEQFKKLLIK